MKLCNWIKESISRLIINASLKKEESVVCVEKSSFGGGVVVC
jgi:hypothetical protein